jgi:hypothetical protein
MAVMTRLALAIMFLLGCADHVDTSNTPVLSGDACALHSDSASCAMDSECQWLGTGCACPPNDPTCVCSPGACVSIHGSSGSGSGSGSTSVACVCPNGEVCYEQVGGPAQPAGSTPQIECTLPASGTGDPCARIEGQGTCIDSTTVTGLCVCDNGIR